MKSLLSILGITSCFMLTLNGFAKKPYSSVYSNNHSQQVCIGKPAMNEYTIQSQQARFFSAEVVGQIAFQNAQSLYGEVFGTEPLPLYDAADELIGYRFDFAIGRPFDPEQISMMAGAQENDGQQQPYWGYGTYANLFVSARSDLDVIQNHSNCLSPYWANKLLLEELAATELKGSPELKRAYYINFQNQWFCYTNGSREVFVKVFPQKKVVSESEFREIIANRGYFCAQGDFSGVWEQYLSGWLLQPMDQVLTGNADLCPYYDWSYGCSPTASAMLLGYWDAMSMVSAGSRYPSLVDWHYERFDNVENETDTQVANLQRQLAVAMSTDTMNGTTWDFNIGNGIATVANVINGYNFTVNNYLYFYNYQWYFNTILSEIDNNRPCINGITDHSECTVGYDAAAHEVGVHNTWWASVDWISWTQLVELHTILPGGSDGIGVEIIHPDGDLGYNLDGYGENWIAQDAFEIKWNTTASPGSYVKLFYNTDANGSNVWTTISENTQNDGEFDWLIPAAINSTTCRVKIETFTPGGTFQGSDGSFGNFMILPGTGLKNLADDVKANTQREPDYFSFYHPHPGWCAVGVRRNKTGEDWDMRLFNNASFDTMLVSAVQGPSQPVDLVVIDGHHAPVQSRGIKCFRFMGDSSAKVEFEGGTEIYQAGNTYLETWEPGDVVEMTDVHLTPGLYLVRLLITSGTADLGVALFGQTGTSWYGNKLQSLALSDNPAPGGDETFWINITVEDDYGLCVWANDAHAATYQISVARPGVWKGDVSSNWHDPQNWSAGFIPNDTLDVEIPTALFNCVVSSADASCRNCNILTGGQFINMNKTLTINGDLTVNGNFYMNCASTTAITNVMGNVTWNGNSRCILEFGTMLKVFGNWISNPGTEVITNLGTVCFLGPENSILQLNESDWKFFNLWITKANPAFASIAYTSSDTLYVNGNLLISPGSVFNLYSAMPVQLEGELTGTICCYDGVFVFDGVYQTVILTSASFFHHVTNKSGFTILTTDIAVNGNLHIQDGILKANGITLYIRGNWNNTPGPAAFNEQNSTVVFDGGNIHQYIYGNECFNILEVAKTQGNVLRIPADSVFCNQYHWVAGGIDVLQGKFVAADIENPGLFGSWYLNQGGLIDITNNDGFVDINGDVHIFGGMFNIRGGTSDSYWPYYADASLEMTGGILDFKDRGILVYNSPTQTFTENITGGLIRTSGSLRVDRIDFTPAGGTFELYGSGDAAMHTETGSNLCHLTINKGTGTDITGGSAVKHDVRETVKTPLSAPDANLVYLDNNLDLTGNLLIHSGSLSAQNFILSLGGSWSNLQGDAGFDEGNSLVRFTGPEQSTIFNQETFYNLTVDKAWNGFEGLNILHDLHILNNLSIQDGTMELDSPSNLTTGNLDIFPGAGLNANDSYGPLIQIHGNYYDGNGSYSNTQGFHPGENSVVIFSGEGDQYAGSVNGTTFANLVINKPSGIFKPTKGITTLADLALTDGEWEDNDPGFVHTVYGDFLCSQNGSLNNAFIYNTFHFAGPAGTIIRYLSSNGYFHSIIINKEEVMPQATFDPGQTPAEPQESTAVNNMTVMLESNISCQQEGNLVIENGILDLDGNQFLGTGDIIIAPGGTLRAGGSSHIYTGSWHTLQVENGGILEVTGSEPYEAVVGRTGTGSFSLNVSQGGMLKASNASFSHMGISGLHLSQGAILHPDHSLNGCRFLNGDGSVSTLITANNEQVSIITGADFPANTWGGGYNVWKSVDTGQIIFVGATGDFAGPAFEFDPYNRIDWINGNLATVNGQLTYDNQASTPMSSSVVYLMNDDGQHGACPTGSTGEYTFDSVFPGNYYLMAETGKPFGGINSTDALITMQHFVQLLTLEGLKLQAADVDLSQNINATDALLIMKRFVNQINSFPAGDWLFETTAFPVAADDLTMDMKALCYGDVNGSFNLPALSGQTGLGGDVPLVAEPDVPFFIPLIFTTSLKPAAVSLVFDFPSEQLDILDVRQAEGKGVLCYKQEDGVLRIAWYSLESPDISEGGACFLIETVRKDAGDALKLITNLRTMEVADAMGHIIRPVSLLNPLILPEKPGQGNIIVLGNNPARDYLMLDLWMPSSGNLELQLYNNLGVSVIPGYHRIVEKEGHTQLCLDIRHLPSGVYLLKSQLHTGNNSYFNTTKRMIIR